MKTKMKKSKKIILIILCVLLSLIIIVCAAFAFLYFKGRGRFNNDDVNISAPNDVIVNDNGTEVEYKGEKYVFNEDIATVLLIGIDRKGDLGEKELGDNGQADALYLAVLDTEKNTVKILSVSRDSLTLIDKYSKNGLYIGQENDYLCRSFSYGNGIDAGSQLTVKAVSRILYNIPIHSYVTIDVDGSPLLCDAVGGVTVPEYDEGDLTQTGNMIELNSSNVVHYLLSRNYDTVDTNNIRMEKHKYFIKAFSEKLIAQTKESVSKPVEIYNLLDDSGYMTTDIGLSEVTYLATNYIGGISDISFVSVPGYMTSTEEDENGYIYAQFNIDYDGLYEIILDLFYVKK